MKWIFIGRFFLPLLVAVIAVFVFNNIYKFDWHQRISLGVGILTIAYFASHTLHKSSQEKEAAETATPAPPSTSSTSPSPAPGSQTTKGNHSPIVQGNGNSVVINPATTSRETPITAVQHIAILAAIREGELLTVEIAFSNIGKGIARSVHQQTVVESTDNATFDPQWTTLRSTLNPLISSDLPQGVVKSVKTPVPVLRHGDERPHAAPLPKDQAKQILSGRRKIGVAEVFRYSDEDGHKFETTYCAVYNPVKHPFFDECPGGNRTHMAVR